MISTLLSVTFILHAYSSNIYNKSSEMCDAASALTEETFAVYNRFFGVSTRRFWSVGLPKYYTYNLPHAHTLARDIRHRVSVIVGIRHSGVRVNQIPGIHGINGGGPRIKHTRSFSYRLT